MRVNCARRTKAVAYRIVRVIAKSPSLFPECHHTHRGRLLDLYCHVPHEGKQTLQASTHSLPPIIYLVGGAEPGGQNVINSCCRGDVCGKPVAEASPSFS